MHSVQYNTMHESMTEYITPCIELHCLYLQVLLASRLRFLKSPSLLLSPYQYWRLEPYRLIRFW
ncbi:hypothetical protein AB205_0080930 [Aquarana catesbeiana]|uniref:Uncharacterized protein n=1 Tax=Aquarana catesbeiana TaxID=8400 RepID=A0A2G9RC17_AQUCT|nr:hypothetical protein AB205_0080930 [Aquarana catesbeiana]